LKKTNYDTSAGQLSSQLMEYIVDQDIILNPFIVDIGANDGVYHSNSRYFLERGWSAILIEPVSKTFQQLVKNCAKYADNICFLNVAANKCNGMIRIHRHVNDAKWETNDGGASLLSHFSSGDGWDCIGIDCMTLASFCTTPGILSVDTEGYDSVILTRWLQSDSRPPCIVTEDLTDWGNQQEKHDLLSTSGYRFWKNIAGNDIYVLSVSLK